MFETEECRTNDDDDGNANDSSSRTGNGNRENMTSNTNNREIPDLLFNGIRTHLDEKFQVLHFVSPSGNRHKQCTAENR